MARTPTHYESGLSGDACPAGFAVRDRALVVHITAESPEQAAALDVLLATAADKRWRLETMRRLILEE